MSFNIEITFDALYSQEGLEKIDESFLFHLKTQQYPLYELIKNARQKETPLSSGDLLDIAPYLEEFLSSVFNIQGEIAALKKQHEKGNIIAKARRNIIQRQAVFRYNTILMSSFEGERLREKVSLILGDSWSEVEFADALLNPEIRNLSPRDEAYDTLLKYAAWACQSLEGRILHQNSALFYIPLKKIDFENQLHHTIQNKTPSFHLRDGFNLLDPGLTQNQALQEAHYCLHCHRQKKDSCSTGFYEKERRQLKKEERVGFLTGCPLDQKISEMNLLKTQGYSIAALGVVMMDNPLVAVTGHRICNDCMHACIFQGQEPVNIPGIETQILTEVLNLPWGVEIYSLLMRWNPLKSSEFLPLKPTPYRILVVGMGPAGFTLAHYLIQQGHTVVGIDGLNISPLLPSFSRTLIQRVSHLWRNLEERSIGGFGGVCEYGITARWDKNYLDLIRLILERQESFRIFGNIRYGGTITGKLAFEMGFHHIALCTGGGRAKIPSIKNGSAKGVRLASDFLMSLHAVGSYKKESAVTFNIELPAVIMGGGLTAMDTATEVMAYYPRYVEKLLSAYDACPEPPHLSEREQKLIDHGRLVRSERMKAQDEKRLPNFIPFIQAWGGVTVVYHKEFMRSASIQLNPDEVKRAAAQGVRFLEKFDAKEFIADDDGDLIALQGIASQENRIMDVKTVLIAVGMEENPILKQEEPLISASDFYDEEGIKGFPPPFQNKETPYIFGYVGDGQSISLLGDAHPTYAGSVVKAIASAKNAVPFIQKIVNKKLPYMPQSGVQKSRKDFFGYLEGQFLSSVISARFLDEHTKELIIRSPLAAKMFQPGHLFRLWHSAPHPSSPKGKWVPMTGIKADRDQGTLGFIVHNRGLSSSLLAQLKAGDSVNLMGPTGQAFLCSSQDSILMISQGFSSLLMKQLEGGFSQNGARVFHLSSGGHVETLARDLRTLPVALSVITTLLVTMGPGEDLRGLQVYYQEVLRHLLSTKHRALMWVQPPMQCMMKGMCGQCLQHLKNPDTQEEMYVFGCSSSFENFSHIYVANMKNRLAHNALMEKLYAAGKR